MGSLAVSLSQARTLGLEVAGLRRRQRLEQGAVRLDVEERRLVETVETADADHQPVAADHLDDRSSDRNGAHRRAEREGAAADAVVVGALLHEIASRQVKPVQDLQALELVDAVERVLPAIEDLDPADRTVGPAMARRHQPRGPWRADAADEDEAGVGGGWQIDRDLAVTNFLLTNHGQCHLG